MRTTSRVNLRSLSAASLLMLVLVLGVFTACDAQRDVDPVPSGEPTALEPGGYEYPFAGALEASCLTGGGWPSFCSCLVDDLPERYESEDAFFAEIDRRGRDCVGR